MLQLIDDALDFVASEKEMGKPTGADLCLGLATAPVLFAAHQFPRLNSLIMRRFEQPGDVEEALILVKKVCLLFILFRIKKMRESYHWFITSAGPIYTTLPL